MILFGRLFTTIIHLSLLAYDEYGLSLSYEEVGQNVGLVIDCKSDIVESGMMLYPAV